MYWYFHVKFGTENKQTVSLSNSKKYIQNRGQINIIMGWIYSISFFMINFNKTRILMSPLKLSVYNVKATY